MTGTPARVAALRDLGNGATLHRSGQSAQERIGEYLEWAADAADRLSLLVSAEDVARLVLTPGYDRLLTAMALPGTDIRTQRVLNLMRSNEEQQRGAALTAAMTELQAQAQRWDLPGMLIAPDTSFFLRHDDKLRDADFAALLDDTSLPVHVLLLISVVDELDRLKETGQAHPRWRAGYTLAVIDEVLKDPNKRRVLVPGHGVVTGSGGAPQPPRGAVTLEIVFDPPGHLRNPDPDTEMVERLVAVQALSARPVTLLTYDTGQSMLGRAAGLEVIKLRKEPGPEPEPPAAKAGKAAVPSQAPPVR